jgi:5-dehydro-2-deoxygluconokinase
MSTPTLIFAIDHRPIMAEACEKRGEREPAARIGEFKRLAVDAVLAARVARPDVANRMAILLDDIYGGEAIAAARAAGLPVAQPGEKGAVIPLEFARPDWQQAIVATRPAFLKVRFNGSPDDAPDARAHQEGRLLELSRACEAVGVPLVPEPLLPDGTVDAAEKMARWIAELRTLGIRARWWKLVGFETARDAQRVADGLPSSEGILILGKSAPLEKLAVWFRAARGPRFEGFAVGRSMFWEPFLAYLGGASPAQTVNDLTRAFLDVIKLWEKETS